MTKPTEYTDTREALEVPWQKLSEDALSGLLEELVSRDGTDYGFDESSMDSKVSQLKMALQEQRAFVGFDPETESWSIVPR